MKINVKTKDTQVDKIIITPIRPQFIIDESVDHNTIKFPIRTPIIPIDTNNDNKDNRDIDKKR